MTARARQVVASLILGCLALAWSLPRLHAAWAVALTGVSVLAWVARHWLLTGEMPTDWRDLLRSSLMVPIMAVGRLHYVALRHGLAAEDLVKPSRVQSLAAMGAAMTGREDESIEAAIRVDGGGPVTEPLTAIAGAHVHVFEDSASSLRAAQGLELFAALGDQLVFVLFGGGGLVHGGLGWGGGRDNRAQHVCMCKTLHFSFDRHPSMPAPCQPSQARIPQRAARRVVP